jgi:hypothetical protein
VLLGVEAVHDLERVGEVLTSAPTCPIMRVTPGDSDAPCTPSAASRGQKPAAHSSQE